jgi:periplasmic divalent cation tolerance protein
LRIVELPARGAVTGVVLVLTTVPIGEQGEVIARALVDERLAACVNLLAPMTSFYRWNGTVERDVERQVVIKTTSQQVAILRERVAQMHPYELPEFVVLEVADGSSAYLDWVRTEAAPDEEQSQV